MSFGNRPLSACALALALALGPSLSALAVPTSYTSTTVNVGNQTPAVNTPVTFSHPLPIDLGPDTTPTSPGVLNSLLIRERAVEHLAPGPYADPAANYAINLMATFPLALNGCVPGDTCVGGHTASASEVEATSDYFVQIEWATFDGGGILNTINQQENPEFDTLFRVSGFVDPTGTPVVMRDSTFVQFMRDGNVVLLADVNDNPPPADPLNTGTFEMAPGPAFVFQPQVAHPLATWVGSVCSLFVNGPHSQAGTAATYPAEDDFGSDLGPQPGGGPFDPGNDGMIWSLCQVVHAVPSPNQENFQEIDAVRLMFFVDNIDNNPVPEPTAGLLLAMGAVAFGLARRGSRLT